MPTESQTQDHTSWVICSIQNDTINDDNSQHVHLIPVNKDGLVEGVDGRSWHYDGAALLHAAKNTKTELPVDYHHASLSARSTGAAAPAAGWIDPSTLESNAAGLFGIVVWTDAAANAIRNREFRYTSPVFTYTQERVVALKGSALTHYPNLTDLKPVANSESDDALLAINDKENPMDELLERLRYLLNLPTLATADEIKSALDDGFARMKSAAGDTAANAERLDDLATCWQQQLAANSIDTTTFVPRCEFDRVKSELTALTTERQNARVDTAVNDALERGVISPAALPWAREYCRKDPEGFAQFAVNAVHAVPLGEASNSQTVQAAGALTEEEIAVCSSLNISQDDFKKQKEEL